MNLLERIQEANSAIRERTEVVPEIGLVLGSGLGEIADHLENAVKIDYEDIPHFPLSTVEGHAGQLVIGELRGKKVIAQKGRLHYYEGYSMQQVTFPVRVMRALGAETLLVTNACGGLNSSYSAGSLMFIRDHINLTGANPLIGENFEELGPRFADATLAYDKALIQLGQGIASRLSIKTETGVYVGHSGPSFPTNAELKMMRMFGADVVGQSTVGETITAVHGGMRVLGISCITDMAVPDEVQSVKHEEVLAAAEAAKPQFINLVSRIVEEM